MMQGITKLLCKKFIDLTFDTSSTTLLFSLSLLSLKLDLSTFEASCLYLSDDDVI